MSSTIVEPYLLFGGRCEEALEFYRQALGARIDLLMRYRESPAPMPPGSIPPGFEDKVMHASVQIGATRIMASDGNKVGTNFEGFSLSFTANSDAEARRVFAELSAGGTVGMPLAKTFWSSCFGMVTDRFGMHWMVTVGA